MFIPTNVNANVLFKLYIMLTILKYQGPVVRSLVSANRWLRGIKTYRFPWYLTLVSANHASSNRASCIILLYSGSLTLMNVFDTKFSRKWHSFLELFSPFFFSIFFSNYPIKLYLKKISNHSRSFGMYAHIQTIWALIYPWISTNRPTNTVKP